MNNILVYDNILDLDYRQTVYRFIEKSYFTIGWSEGVVPERQHHRFLHSTYSETDIENLGILENLKNTEIYSNIKDKKLKSAVVNLTTPADSHFIHTHSETILLYYVNLDWQDGWHGETLFYNNSMNEILFASPYIPGRFILFDGRIPHCVRPQSIIGPKFRFTLAMMFE